MAGDVLILRRSSLHLRHVGNRWSAVRSTHGSTTVFMVALEHSDPRFLAGKGCGTTRIDLDHAVVEYLEIWHNRRGGHDALG